MFSYSQTNGHVKLLNALVRVNVLVLVLVLRIIANALMDTKEHTAKKVSNENKACSFTLVRM